MEATVGFWTALGVNLITAVALLVIGWYAGQFACKTIKNMDKLDKTLRSFLGNLAKYAILAIAGISVLQKFGVEMASLIAILGAAGLAIGLALQGTLSNVAAGVMLLVLRPFNVGDFIESGSIGGTVKELGLITTQINTSDNIFITVPNNQLWNGEIRNFSRNSQRRQDLVFGISYDDDINKAVKTIQKVLDKESRLVTSKGKEPTIVVSNLGDSSVDLTARIWTSTADFWGVQWDLKKTVKEALDKDGITIPFPTQTLEVSNPSAFNAQDNKKKAA